MGLIAGSILRGIPGAIIGAAAADPGERLEGALMGGAISAGALYGLGALRKGYKEEKILEKAAAEKKGQLNLFSDSDLKNIPPKKPTSGPAFIPEERSAQMDLFGNTKKVAIPEGNVSLMEEMMPELHKARNSGKTPNINSAVTQDLTPPVSLGTSNPAFGATQLMTPGMPSAIETAKTMVQTPANMPTVLAQSAARSQPGHRRVSKGMRNKGRGSANRGRRGNRR
jgi:hypothetical protein